MIHTDVFAKLLGILEAIQARSATPTRLSLGAAASVVALTIVLRYLTAKQPKLITDYAKVARKVNDNGAEVDEWDFIIVGGGMVHSIFHTSSQHFLSSERIQAQQDVFSLHVSPKTQTCGFYSSRLVEGQHL